MTGFLGRNSSKFLIQHKKKKAFVKLLFFQSSWLNYKVICSLIFPKRRSLF